MKVRSIKRVLLGPILLFLATTVSAQGAAEELGLRFEPYTAETAEGAMIEGQLGRIRVPQKRGVKNGKKIDIAFALFKSTNPKPGAPIVFLAGGPGAAGIDYGVYSVTDPRLNLLDNHDLIAIDQRGTGLSLPNLSGGPEFDYALPLDRTVTRAELADAFTEAAQRCVEYWTAEGVDLSAYNSEESADDVDDVRRALGIEKVIPWGTSYGSHLGLAYLRRHAKHVERAVLMKVEGPDHTYKLPSSIQERLEGLDALIKASPAYAERLPDFLGTVKGLLEQLEREPVVVSANNGREEVSVTVGPLDLQMIISTALGHSNTLATLPKAVYMMSQGEWRHVIGFVMGNRRGSVGSGMSLAMDCASGVTAERLARIERERQDPVNLLGDAIYAPYYIETCEPCAAYDLGDKFRGALRCRVPVLFVSGELDARTPPSNVEDIRKGFRDAAHIRVTNTGHDSRELESEDYCNLVQRFLDGDRIEDVRIELPPVEFMP